MTDDTAGVDLSGTVDAWIGGLPPYQQTTVSAMLQREQPIDVAVTWLQNVGPNETAPLGAIRAGASLLYDNLLEELQKFLCTGQGYEVERLSLAKQASAGKATVVALITSAIAPHLGAAAALAAPPVAITLAIVGRASQAATCQALDNLIKERHGSDDKAAG